MRRLVALSILFCLVIVVHSQDSTFTLTLLQTSDTHSNHLPRSNGDGGVARQASVVNQIRAEEDNVLLIDTGDRFSGTLFYTLYRGSEQSSIMNALGYDAMVLGNHEFNDGDATLANFIGELNFPIVVANADFSGSPELSDLIQPYTILEVNGERIGLIGLILADTPNISSPSPAITFSDDYANIANQYAEELTEQGINKIILLSHIDYAVDLTILPQLRNIDVVMGGNSDSFFSNTLVNAIAPAPFFTEDADGQRLYYTQAGSNNAYLARLDVTFDADGVVTNATGDTILLSRYITPDPILEAIVVPLSAGVEELQNSSIGATTLVNLDGTRSLCRSETCSMGNVIADSIRIYTGAEIALVNAGGIRASLPEGDITMGQVMTVQPFANTIRTFIASGRVIRDALENGVSRVGLLADGTLDYENLSGRLMQVSGLRYSYDPRQEVGSRILSVEVMSSDGTYQPLLDGMNYLVATNNFILNGGDGYSMLAEDTVEQQSDGRYDYEILIEYLLVFSPISEELVSEQRITLQLNN
jgi:5'-nucleotidase / UDP-sugar diphosphatase